MVFCHDGFSWFRVRDEDGGEVIGRLGKRGNYLENGLRSFKKIIC
jgi:hypothetical protein